MRLTPNMRGALEAIRRQPARRVHAPGPGKPPWPQHPNTLAALLRHGLVDHEVGRDRRRDIYEQWTITDAGRLALDPPPRIQPDKPRYLSRPSASTGDYTHDRHRAIDDLPVMDPPSPEWERRARQRHHRDQNAKAWARRARAA